MNKNRVPADVLEKQGVAPQKQSHRMPHEDLAENEVEITIDENGQVSVRGNNLDRMEEVREMLAEIGIYLEDSEAQ